MTAKNKNLHLIQMLRGIASLLVVMLHITGYTNEALKKDFCFKLFFFGGSGVDIFFVLSGFIITYTSLNTISRSNKLLPFVRKRIIRIFPIYWITITIFLFIQIALPSFYRTHYDLNVVNLASTYLLLPGHAMVNGVSWTLTYELFFYLLFSFAFVIRHKKVVFFLAMFYAIVLILIWLTGFNADNKNEWINLAVFPMNIEFFLGVLAAVLIPKIPSSFCKPLIFFGCIIFLTAGLFFDFGYHLLSNNFNRVLLFGVPAFLIITGLVKLELSRNIVVNKWLVLLGEASYSLYLLHLPIVVACIKIIAKFNINSSIILHLILFSIIAGTCYFSTLFYKWIEKPVIIKLNAVAQHNKKFKLEA